MYQKYIGVCVCVCVEGKKLFMQEQAQDNQIYNAYWDKEKHQRCQT